MRITIQFKDGSHYHSTVVELIAVAHSNKQLFRKPVWEAAQKIMKKLEKAGVVFYAYPTAEKYLILKKGMPADCNINRDALFKWLSIQYKEAYG